MRCIACDCELTDYESTRKSAVTGEYYDLCNTCFSTIAQDVLALDRPDLMEYSDLDGLDKDIEEN
ncbi:hypothetical protein [Caudoviricetes sp.]|nr:hypothetical protein [Caudoviricetes sp.]